MKKKLLFLILSLILLTPWPVAYAYDNGLASELPVRIEAATADQPGWTAYGRAIGGVSQPVDLFYVDTAETAADTVFTLYLTNAYQLSNYYRYLILNIAVYTRDESDNWEKLGSSSGEVFADTYLTMRNGGVSFSLPGYARYKLTVDGGSFYCYRSGDGADLAPRFYLEAGEEMN
ncbi:hypothetical protein ACFLV1_02135 [Chloroflexota bacterium]